MNYQKNVIRINGEDIEYFKVDHASDGTPRYVIHFLALDIDLDDYGKIPGLTKYRAKWFGGGYVFSTFQLEQTLENAFKTVKKYYGE
ncbi:hypothetical protein Q7A53_05870 [Halobacillus rhizosphaerae]|uniref:hypothetical protein n=1 Tax=Halobacillus rhizosphaerae TaxID=3064889 RepID=UPI00398A5ED0